SHSLLEGAMMSRLPCCLPRAKSVAARGFDAVPPVPAAALPRAKSLAARGRNDVPPVPVAAALPRAKSLAARGRNDFPPVPAKYELLGAYKARRARDIAADVPLVPDAADVPILVVSGAQESCAARSHK